jgi:hypothetical protein
VIFAIELRDDYTFDDLVHSKVPLSLRISHGTVLPLRIACHRLEQVASVATACLHWN